MPVLTYPKIIQYWKCTENTTKEWTSTKKIINDSGVVMEFNATFNNISVILWRSVLLVEETRVLGENY